MKQPQTKTRRSNRERFRWWQQDCTIPDIDYANIA